MTEIPNYCGTYRTRGRQQGTNVIPPQGGGKTSRESFPSENQRFMQPGAEDASTICFLVAGGPRQMSIVRATGPRALASVGKK